MVGVAKQDTKTLESSPAAVTECKKCKKKAHWARMCKSKTVRQVTVKEGSEESFYLGAVRKKIKLTRIYGLCHL